MKRAWLFVLVTVLASGAWAQQVASPDLFGHWVGALSFGGMELRVVFNVSKTPEGAWTATMDSPDQGAKDIPVSGVKAEGDSVFFEVAVAMGRYCGLMKTGGEIIEGKWKQGGMDMPLVLKHSSVPIETAKSQEPKKPYPYLEEEVSYENTEAGIRISGTLTLPKTGGPFPAVILLTGSGSQDRNEAIMGHKPFMVLADALTRRGIAVLRCDDRGVGGTTGQAALSTTLDHAKDAGAGLKYLKTRKDIRPGQIGFLGHSEGGIIGPIAAAEDPDVAFVVMLAGTGIPGDELMYLQAAAISRTAGSEEEAIAQNRKIQEAMFQIVKSEKSDSIKMEELRQGMADGMSALSDSEKASLGNVSAYLENQIRMVMSPWFRTFVSLDPRVALRQVRCPVLALFGSKDLQVPPEPNAPEVEKALASGGNKDYTVKVIPGVNHLFQTARTGLPTEYSKIEETLSPEVLKIIGDWIVGRTLEAGQKK